MAEAKARSYSRPVFDQQVILQSEQAQRVYEREFRRVVEALYAIDVILRIIGDSQEADSVEGMVSEMIGECANEIKNEQARFDKLKEDNGITVTPRYTHPGQVQIRIVSPQAAQFAALLRNMDALMISLDTLWLCGVMGNKQRGNGVYQWQQRLLRLGRRIVDIERRARACARKQGKDDEVREATGESGDGIEGKAAGLEIIDVADVTVDFASKE
ncbi:MAG: hypothetical protein NTX45_07885 [Proteobacteria bacterium]|nr:hypothetical protein [Pseudomonadota bacterium]